MLGKPRLLASALGLASASALLFSFVQPAAAQSSVPVKTAVLHTTAGASVQAEPVHWFHHGGYYGGYGHGYYGGYRGYYSGYRGYYGRPYYAFYRPSYRNYYAYYPRAYPYADSYYVPRAYYPVYAPTYAYYPGIVAYPGYSGYCYW